MSKVDLHRYKDYEALNSKHSVDYVIQQLSSGSATQHIDVTNYSQVMISCSSITNIRFAATEEDVSSGGVGAGEWDISDTSNPDENGHDIVLLTVPHIINDIKVDTVILNIRFYDVGEKAYIWLM